MRQIPRRDHMRFAFTTAIILLCGAFSLITCKLCFRASELIFAVAGFTFIFLIRYLLPNNHLCIHAVRQGYQSVRIDR